MARVILRDGESGDSICRRFRRAVDNAGTLRDWRKHEFHEPQPKKNKRMQMAAIKRQRRVRGERDYPRSTRVTVSSNKGPAKDE
jgi:ribosomal protein S21